MNYQFRLTAILLTLVVSVNAQNSVTLHTQCNYGGAQFQLEPGNYRDYQMKITNDRLSSLQIPYGFKVTIYEHDKFTGRSKTFTENISCIDTEFRNMASSIVVEGPYNVPGQTTGTGTDYITFYNDCYSKGFTQSLRPGKYTGSQLGASRFNISSFVITGNLRIRAYMNNETLSGAAITYETSQACMSSSYNDRIGSLVIEYKPGTGPSYPGTGNTTGSGSFATLFTGCNFDGNAIRLMPGTYNGEKLGLVKFNASSIDLGPNLRAKVYLDNENLSGSAYTIEDDIACMTSNLRNRIGSVIIEVKNGTGQNPNVPGGESVVVYTDENYKGMAAYLLPGTYSTMVQVGFSDNALSSLTIPAGFRVVLYEFENFKGKSYSINQSKSGFSFSGWNDKTSSLIVYRD